MASVRRYVLVLCLLAGLAVFASPTYLPAQNLQTTATSDSSHPLLQYTLPPDKLEKAYALYLLNGALYFVTTVWSFFVLYLMLRTRFGVRLRNLATTVSRFRVQQWGSWFWDWGKGLLLGCLFASVLGWILYAVLRGSPRRWWFYFWLAIIPIVVFVIFIQPIWIDPLFNKFEPLTGHHADLVAQ